VLTSAEANRRVTWTSYRKKGPMSSPLPTSTTPAHDVRAPRPTAGRGPGHLGPSLVVDGDIITGEDIVLDGRLNGSIHAPDNAVSIAASAAVRGRIFARVVLIEGNVSGEVAATGLIEVSPGARVEADLIAPAIAVAEGAFMVGKIDMRRAEAAARVARYRAERGTEGRAPAPSAAK
jgi:cytoskeletal protein CcmA (bactofilin family)